jgi:hypothetical protein
VSGDVHDVPGTTVRGSDGEKPGKEEDVIVDHDTMEMFHLVVDSGDFRSPPTTSLASELTRQQIENSPRYDAKSLRSKDEWHKYEQEFKQYWEEGPIMHLKNSDRTITPADEPVPAKADSKP